MHKSSACEIWIDHNWERIWQPIFSVALLDVPEYFISVRPIIIGIFLPLRKQRRRVSQPNTQKKQLHCRKDDLSPVVYNTRYTVFPDAIHIRLDAVWFMLGRLRKIDGETLMMWMELAIFWYKTRSKYISMAMVHRVAAEHELWSNKLESQAICRVKESVRFKLVLWTFARYVFSKD